MHDTVGQRKLAIGTMVRFAYRNVFGRLELIPELGWIMLLALLAVSIVPNILFPVRQTMADFRLDWRDYLQAAVALLALSAFAVRWHQSILLGDARRQPPALFFRAWLRFLAYGLAIYILLGIVVAAAALAIARQASSAPAQGLAVLTALILCWLLLLATARCALVFPAAACDKPLGLGAAWRLMGGNSWRLVWATILTALPVKIVTFGFTAILLAIALPQGGEFVTTPPVGFVILTGVIEAVSDVVLAALGASILSGFYRELASWRAAAPSGIEPQR